MHGGGAGKQGGRKMQWTQGMVCRCSGCSGCSAPELGRPGVLPLPLLSPLALDFCGAQGRQGDGQSVSQAWGQGMPAGSSPC